MIIIYIFIYYSMFSKSTVFKVVALISVIDKGVLPLDKKSVGIQFYLDVENKDRLSHCKVKLWTKKCFNADPDDKKSNHMTVYGANTQIVKPKNREILLSVYPTVIQQNHVGYCKFVLDYRCGKIKKIKREEIIIPFDTRPKKTNIIKNFNKKTICASIDQDVLNDCEPVNCDLKYFGTKPFYDEEINKCVAAPTCMRDFGKDLPDVVYDPRSNTCKDLENPLTIADVYAITSGLGLVTEPTNRSGVAVQLHSNCSTISENIRFLTDLIYGKFYVPYQGSVLNFDDACNSAILAIVSSIFVLSCSILGLVCGISFLLWLTKNASIDKIKNVCRKIRSKLNKLSFNKCSTKRSRVNEDVKNKLLKDIILTNLPMELRESFENICERINKEVKWKKRYRREDLGSRINLVEAKRVRSENSSVETTNDNDDQ